MLKSVIIHHGMYDYGHYITIRMVDKRWFFISDESIIFVLFVKINDFLDVSELPYRSSLDDYKSKAYMLFYEKIKIEF